MTVDATLIEMVAAIWPVALTGGGLLSFDAGGKVRFTYLPLGCRSEGSGAG
ncbi:hypothetical protein [Sagittula stellata]|uniref:hypothetical protein n=1 Tax=Sagittula stellata TaxID=52603 RepID=UPI0012F515CE